MTFQDVRQAVSPLRRWNAQTPAIAPRPRAARRQGGSRCRSRGCRPRALPDRASDRRMRRLPGPLDRMLARLGIEVRGVVERPKSLVTASAMLSPMRMVPASWCVVPRSSRRFLNAARDASRCVREPAGTGITVVPLARISNGSLPAKISAILSDTASISSQLARSPLVYALPGKSCGRVLELPRDTNASADRSRYPWGTG